jgi:hypothetical protein
MTDATETDRRTGDGVLAGLSLLLVAVVVLGALVVVAMVASIGRVPGWALAVVGLATASVVVLVASFTSSWRDPPTWLAVAGVALVVAGSGIGRTRDPYYTGSFATDLEGEIVGRLPMTPVLVAVGALLLAGAFLWVTGALGGRARRRSAAGVATLAAYALGVVVIAVVWQDVTVGAWMA